DATDFSTVRCDNISYMKNDRDELFTVDFNARRLVKSTRQDYAIWPCIKEEEEKKSAAYITLTPSPSYILNCKSAIFDTLCSRYYVLTVIYNIVLSYIVQH